MTSTSGRALGVIFLSALAACVAPLTPPAGAQLSCVDAGDCPAPLRCAVGAGICLDPASGCVTVIDEVVLATADGEPCARGEGSGLCVAGVCVEAHCGDGFLSPGEACDAGARNSDVEADACRADCTRPRCGDGVVDGGESCDEDSDSCFACLALCREGTANCDDSVEGCECAPQVIAGEAIDYTALAADGDALWLAGAFTGPDGNETRLERHRHSGEMPITVATFAGLVTQLIVAGDVLLVRESAAPVDEEFSRLFDSFLLGESRWSRVDLRGGGATPLVRSYGGIAVKDGELAYVADDEAGTRSLFRGRLDNAAPPANLGPVACRTGAFYVATSGCDVAFRGGDVIVRDDQGSLLIAPRDGALRAFVDIALAETLAVVGDDVLWTSAGAVVRRRGDGPVVQLAQLPSTRGLVVAPPLAFVSLPLEGLGSHVVSLSIETGGLVGRGTGGGQFAADARGIYWLDTLEDTSFAQSPFATHLALVR
jgi:hypothetical protein